MATMRHVKQTILRVRVRPTKADLETTVRKACDPRSCLFNLSLGRALHKQLKGEITKVWVDGGHHRFSWQASSDRYRWSADTPRWVKNALIALDKWDRKGRKQGLPCPIKDAELKPYTIEFRRLHRITASTTAQKEAAYARVQKQREEGYRPARRRSLHDRVVGYA
jgi:hypothetical protein